MKEKGFTTTVFVLLAFLTWGASCSPQLDTEAVKTEALAIHDRVLTVDTHSDTPMRLLREGWDIGERHDPSQRGSGKIDLPRMAEGGLDAEFFAVFIGQGERTPEGYAKAKGRAMQMLAAIHKMCGDYPHLVELATSPEDAYRIEYRQGSFSSEGVL